ncbi:MULTISPECIES: Ig-like domain-containing protein [unclassified Microbacterium]|uniref:Ig-like domain-containing protein n=1 Tax=unclassified Microbacterium TaxID=2609290 RepID=UPI0012F8DFA5|nr:hypothetical protein [Microbacterium sp. MAH-37]MVQ43923.1 hypothetical protein [Microbacterium sp. MAH-37]
MSGGDAPLTRAQLRAQREAAEAAAKAAAGQTADPADAGAPTVPSDERSTPSTTSTPAPAPGDPAATAPSDSAGVPTNGASAPSAGAPELDGPATGAPTTGDPAAKAPAAGARAPSAGAPAADSPATGAPASWTDRPGVGTRSDVPDSRPRDSNASERARREPIRPEIMGPEPEDGEPVTPMPVQPEPEREPRIPAIMRRRGAGGEPIRPELMDQEPDAASASDPQRAAVFAAAAAAAAAAAEAAAESAGRAPGPRRSPSARTPAQAASESVPGPRRTGNPGQSPVGTADEQPPGPRRSSASEPGDVPPVPTPTSPVSRLDPVPWEPSAEPESDGSAYKRRRRLYIVLAAVAAVLLIAGGIFAFVFSQSLRVLGVDFDPARAVEASGTTLTFDTNHDLAAVDAAQVSVEPAVPFTVKVDGSSLGIRFTDALDDTTKFTVTVKDAAAEGGSPTADLSTTFTTPKSQIFLLQRSDKKDKIFASDLSGENGVPVFSSSKIVDFRATLDSLVVVVEEDGGSRLIVMDHKGDRQRDLKLPGDGYITSLQVSDRGGLVGYAYSDADVTETSGRASVLVTQPLDGSSGPSVVQVGGEDVGVSDWEFVPDSSKVLFVDFSNELILDDRAGDAPAQDFGLVAELLGTTRDTAIIERTEGTFIELSLEDGTEEPLPATDPDYGMPSEIVPFPGGTLQHVVQRNDSGAPTGQAVIRVDPDGTATPVFEVGDDSSIIQMCASPSGQYAAVTVAPDVANNPYDELLLPLPTTLHTTLLDLRTGDQLVTLSGFDVSWCGSAP